MGRFAKALTRLRVDAGFPTAYAFYHRSGGRRAFPFSYAFYTQIERGKTLPRAEWLPLLLSLMRLPADPVSRREILVAYLRDSLRSDEVFEGLFEPLLRPPAPVAPEQAALRRLIGRQARPLSPAEFGIILESPASYWSFAILAGSRRPVTVERLASRCALRPDDVSLELARLATAGLAKRSNDGSWSSPLANVIVVLPRNYKGYARDLARLRGYWDEMADRRGGDLFDLGTLARLPTTIALEAIDSFRSVIETATARYEDEDSPEAPFFLLQARVRRVLPA